MANIERINKINSKSLSNKDLSLLFENIIDVCGDLPEFKNLKNNVDVAESKSVGIKNKIEKQQLLLNQSFKIKKELDRKIKLLNDENQKDSSKLLYALGSNL